MDMRWKTSVAVGIAFIAVACITAGIASADGSWLIHGIVTDRYGDAVQGAVVDVYGYDDGILGRVTTDSYGMYSFFYPGLEQLVRLDVIYQNHLEQTQWVTAVPGMPVELNVTIRDLPPSGYGELYGIISKSADSIVYASGVVFTDSGHYHIVDAVEHNQWSLHLPVGSYDIWAQHNSGGYSYYSQRNTVNVTSDTRLYLPLVIDFTVLQSLVEYPEPGDNRVYGTVFQADGTELEGANVELVRIWHGGGTVVAETVTDTNGAYEFSGVMEYNSVASYTVKASYGQGFTAGNDSSETFEIYYHDRLGVEHEYSVDVHTDFLWQQNIYDPGGLVRFDGTPGARIEIEGLDTGYTVPSNFTFTPGSYGYRVWLDGYEDHGGTIDYTGEPVLITAELSPMVGNVSIIVEPSIASISLNGDVLGQGEVKLVNLPVGSHAISLDADGYHPQAYDLALSSGAELELVFTLEPFPGNIGIVAPPGAALFLDGTRVGTGTADVFGVEPGGHTLSVELEGYHDYERLFNVPPGGDADISVEELVPLPSLSGDFLGYTIENFINGIAGIFNALLESLGM